MRQGHTKQSDQTYPHKGAIFKSTKTDQDDEEFAEEYGRSGAKYSLPILLLL